MTKKSFIVGAFLIALGVIFGGGLAFAEDGEAVPTSDQPETNCIDSSDLNCAQDVITASGDEIAEPDDTVEVTDCINGADGTDCVETVVTEYPSSTCDTPECMEILEEAETDSAPAVWPMYVSLGALGLAILVFIVLNIFGRKKK